MENLQLEKDSPTLRRLSEGRNFFPTLTIVFCILFVRASDSNFKQFIHEMRQYIMTEALI